MGAPTLDTVGSNTFTVGFAGQIAWDLDDAVTENVNNENATAIEFGAPVCVGTTGYTPGGIANGRPAVSGGKPMGLAVRQDSEANAAQVAGTTAVVNYAQNKTMSVLKRGYMWCTAAENVAAEDDLCAIVSGNGVGSIQTGAADGTTRLAFQTATTGMAKWKQTVTSGNVGLVSINLV